MKKLLLLMFVMFIPTLLFACGETTEGDVITLSWWGTTDRNVATYQAIELFEAKYPQYKVEGDQSTWSGYQTTLYNRLERGREADIFQVNYNWLYSMDGEYYFLDLNELHLDLTNYPTEEHDPLTINGKLLGLSVSETGYVFYLNQSVYTAAGINTIPRTWDELITAGEAIGAASNGQKYALGRLDPQQVSMLLFSYISQKTGKNVIGSYNKLNFTRAELEDGFAFLNDLRSSNVLIPSNQNDTHANGPTNPQWVTYQNYGGIMQWNTAVSEYQNELPETATLVTAGMFQQTLGEEAGMYKKVSMALAVSKRVAESESKKLAVKTFLEFITTDPEAVKILGVDRGVPSHQTARTILSSSTDPVYTSSLEWLGHNIVQSLFDHQVSVGQDLYIHPYYEHDSFRRIYEIPIEKFLFNTYTANQAINEILARFDSTLASVMSGEGS
jgi:oligogalacturonide transport system substrate-binding protein